MWAGEQEVLLSFLKHSALLKFGMPKCPAAPWRPQALHSVVTS